VLRGRSGSNCLVSRAALFLLDAARIGLINGRPQLGVLTTASGKSRVPVKGAW
jgi:hypothetical protein